jgi:threonylcarbamoyladenosine tRNA methylthiotransferase MtaB
MFIFIETLGCKVNQHESQQVAEQLTQAGHQMVGDFAEADLILINTCTVTQVADKKSRQMINRSVRKNPNAKLIITGCMPENPAISVKIPDGAEIVLKSELSSFLSSLPRSGHLSDRSDNKYRVRRTLLIQTGCDYYCSYCIIPMVRHGRVSFPREQVLEEFNRLVNTGVKEIVLTGINLATWQDQGMDLAALIKELLEVSGDFRIRLGSLEPDLITLELLLLLGTHPQLVPHLHLPLQGATDDLLKRMHRHYTLADYLALCERIQALPRQVNITTDMIIGFPGETENDFKAACDLVEKGLFLDVHAFAYSMRKGTVAANMKQLDNGLIRERMRRILPIIEDAKNNKLSSFQGRPAKVLIETLKSGAATGYTEGYIKVMMEPAGLKEDQFVEVVLGEPVLIGKERGMTAQASRESPLRSKYL